MTTVAARRLGRIDPRMLLAVGGAALLIAWAAWSLSTRGHDTAAGGRLPPEKADISEQVHRFCGECHAYPPPDSFPREVWKKEVERGFAFFRLDPRPIPVPLLADVLRYYEERAPEQYPELPIERAATPPPVAWTARDVAAPAGTDHKSAVSFLDYVSLQPGRPPVILASEMGQGYIMSLDPRDEEQGWTIHGKLHNPAVVIPVDLDGDGISDLVAADLGSFPPSNERCGRVAWFRGNAEGGYAAPQMLLSDVGRVSDVRAADFTGDGRLDLVVASFGWVKVGVGAVYLLEGQPAEGDAPSFKVHLLDDRHGAIHVPPIDLNGDGRIDFIALISQDYEQVVAYLNEGEGKFRREIIYAAPHPAYGSSGIQLVDMDQDGHTDVLYSNGDSLDSPFLLKPFHSVQWLRNPGDGSLRFQHHHLAHLNGVHRAVAGDVDGDGDQDVVAVVFLPGERFPQRAAKNLDAVILLEQVAPGRFARHTLQSQACDHVTCLLADLHGSGQLNLVLGSFFMMEPGVAPALRIFERAGDTAAAAP